MGHVGGGGGGVDEGGGGGGKEEWGTPAPLATVLVSKQKCPTKRSEQDKKKLFAYT